MEKKYPLHLAVASGNYNDVIALVEAGLNINEEDRDHFSPLDVAVKLGYIDIVEFLIKQGATFDHNSHDYWEEYPIHVAAKYGQLEVMKLLMDHDIEDYCAESDYLLIHLAAEGGHINVINYLLDIGMSVDMTSGKNSTPLASAAYYGKNEAVELLFTKGANINHKDNDGNTPLHMASESGKIEVVKFLVEKDNLLNIENDHEKSINQKNEYKYTPLHYASVHGRIEVVKYLIEKGALLNEKDQRGNTCLHIAVQRGDKNLVELLIKSGATYTLIDETENVNLLRVAAEFGKINILEYFFDRGATIDFKNLCDETLLHLATRGGHKKVVEFLINKGADVNAKLLSNGNTPLHDSSQHSYPEVTELLIQKGADIEAKNNGGFTALNIVVKTATFFSQFSKIGDVVKIIIKYMLLKNKTFNFLDDYVHIKAPYIHEWKDFYSDCAEEIKTMEKIYLKNTNLSLCTVLRALFNDSVLLKYLNNENVRDDLEHIENYCSNLSIYTNLSGLVNDRIEKAMKRQQLLEQASLAIDSFIPKLPLESKWKIFSYLSSPDLNNFVKSF